jgi:methyl-accepting chemotaxis protein
MSASIDSVARIAQDKRSVTDDLSDLTQDGGEKILSTNSIIQNISTHVDSMMEIINVINSITSQTELLSMNTAIEAAHAGDYGKGFSVVADEIRKLAENTSDNAKMITVSLNQVLQQIKNALESSNLSAEVFEKISNHINLFIDAFEEITNSTAEVSAGSGEILEAVKSLSFASQSIKTGTEEIKAGTSEINDSLGIIKKNSSDNIEAVRYVDMLTDNIQNVLSENLIISKWNNENADNLNKLIY